MKVTMKTNCLGDRECSDQPPGQPWGVLPTLLNPWAAGSEGGCGHAGWTRSSRHY